MKNTRIIKLALFALLLSSITVHAKEERIPDKTTNCASQKTWDDYLLNFRDKTKASLCHMVKGIDSWFGDEYDFDAHSFTGKVIVGFRQDEETGFDPKLRIRLKTSLPNLNKKLKAFIGRTDEDAFISDSEFQGIDESSNDLKDNDTSWLIGLGYKNPRKKGFDKSVGLKIKSGKIKPYAKIRYRQPISITDGQPARLTQTFFWKKDEGLGSTSNLQYSYKLSDRKLLSSNLAATYRKDTLMWNTGASITLYENIRDNRSIAYSAYIEGEHGENSLVDVPEYGVSINYRKPFLRPWLMLNTSLENRWSHSRNEDEKKHYAKLGVQLEMSFGKEDE